MSEDYLRIATDSPFGEVGLHKSVFEFFVVQSIRETKGAVYDAALPNSKSAVMCYVSDEGLVIDVSIRVMYGYRVQVIIERIQERIIQQIEQATGITTKEVNVFVFNIEF